VYYSKSIASNIWVHCDSDKYALRLPDVGDGCPMINYKVMGQDEKLRILKRHASVLWNINICRASFKRIGKQERFT